MALNLVEEFVKREASSSRVAVVFDLDSTLFCVSPRTRAILQSLGNDPSFQSQFETESRTLKNVEVEPSDWGIRSVLLRHHPDSPMEFFKTVRDYWRRHFFSNSFLEHDITYPSADLYVKHLESLGAEIYYLTGRPGKAMGEGTLRSLQKFGFPLKDPSRLLMKPEDEEADEHFKTQALRELLKSYDHIWFFDNEPVIIHEVRATLPQVHIVFVNSVHSGRAAAPTDLPTIQMSFNGPWSGT